AQETANSTEEELIEQIGFVHVAGTVAVHCERTTVLVVVQLPETKEEAGFADGMTVSASSAPKMLTTAIPQAIRPALIERSPRETPRQRPRCTPRHWD
ncbi:hypothetical protein, partial [Pseudomonas sp.]|uniref:hypothetical protein n=1 Tax=Pseudomonas sp. TaxID=306 RepID=UPI0026229C9B